MSSFADLYIFLLLFAISLSFSEFPSICSLLIAHNDTYFELTVYVLYSDQVFKFLRNSTVKELLPGFVYPPPESLPFMKSRWGW